MIYRINKILLKVKLGIGRAKLPLSRESPAAHREVRPTASLVLDFYVCRADGEIVFAFDEDAHVAGSVGLGGNC